MTVRIVTFLGLGKPDATRPEERYKSCRYRLDEITTPSTFNHDVAAGLRYPGENVFVVLGTADVRKTWFEDSVAYQEELGRHGVANARIVFREIPYGRTPEERWEIFNAIVQCLAPEPQIWTLVEGQPFTEQAAPEEIILDITHGFRSQPFFAASAVSFAKSQARRKKPDLNVRILYAAFDAKPNGSDTADVWDLTQLIEVLDWTAAIDAFMRFGRADDVEVLARAQQKRIMVEMTATSRKGPPPRIQTFGAACRAVADALATARAPELMTHLFPKFEESLEASRAELESGARPLARILDDLKSWTGNTKAREVVSAEGILACIHLAGLYLVLERYAEAAAVLREAVTSAWQLKTYPGEIPQPATPGRPGDKLVVEKRGLSDRMLWRRNQEKQRTPELALNPGEGELLAVYDALSQLRNDVEHAACNDAPKKSSTIRTDLGRLHEDLKGAVQAMLAGPARWAPRACLPGTFLNVSNHPSATWPETQKGAAEKFEFGPPVDVPFPDVDPSWSTAEIERQADELVKKILEKNPAYAMVMGEFTLTAALVARLQKAGVRCVATVSKRVAEERRLPDGTVERKATFEFAGFRDYPLLAEIGG